MGTGAMIGYYRIKARFYLRISRHEVRKSYAYIERAPLQDLPGDFYRPVGAANLGFVEMD